MTPAHGGDWDSYTSPNSRTGKAVLFPMFAGHNQSATGELRGELIDVFAMGGEGLDSEDIVEVGQVQYRAFNLASLGWVAVRLQ
ncbi:hypothetical protein SCOR_32800 [Sulfidibacter corallicola]|uniref:Uncharacterized protein n=1 Tax=Sulfidibacter corallicola TaxID=2818388 RepID=A0A8A4TJF4_SULCO|nr:hypothetical protein [Sulfidibacter corallicola]QTD49680.1 hypothetical protein J3U87_29200 [Sulfidibacter corallicola]